MTFNGFISYSHAADNRLAPAIQRGLHRLAKPWHRRRALWIFRDQTGLAVTPALWSSIQNALDGSDFFVLLASPEAARSPWVNREIEHWMMTKSPDKILPVVTDGEWRWDPTLRDFSDDSTAVPPMLRGVFAEEPLYLDLRWARDDRHLSLRHSRFRDAIAQLAAPMHGVSKDDLEGEDVRQHRRVRRLRSGALASLLLLTFVAVLTGLMALRNADRANAAAGEAHRQELSAVQQRTNAERSAEEARRQQDLATLQEAKARAATLETTRQEALAKTQKVLAVRAAAEATRQEDLARDQKSLAEAAKADAGRQQKNAKLQQQLANRAAQRAQAQQQLAQQQRALSKRWADEAAKSEQAAQAAAKDATQQQHKAELQERIAVGRRLDNQARATLADDPKTALMLGTAADKIQADAESGRALTGLVTSTRYAGTLPGANQARYGHGDVVATRTADGQTSLWNVADRSRPVRLATLGSGLEAPSLSPDGRLLAALGPNHTTQVWDISDPAHPAQISSVPQNHDDYAAPVFSPDGKTLVTITQAFNPPPGPPFTFQAHLWDLTDPRNPAPLATLDADDPIDDVAFSPDGHTLIVDSTTVDVWNVTDRAHPVRLPKAVIDDLSEQLVAFSPTEPILATAELGVPTVVVWDLSDPANPQKKSTLTTSDEVTALAFRPDGNVLSVADSRGVSTQWDITATARPVQLDSVTDTGGTVSQLSYSADGRTLITSGGDDATLWSTTDYGAPAPVGELGADLADQTGAAFSPDGKSMITVDSTGAATFWDVSRPDHPVRRSTVAVHDKFVRGIAFSADRRTIAVGGTDDKVTLMDVTDPAHPTAVADFAVPMGGVRPPEYISTMAFSPDGRTLAIGSTYERLMLWDLSDRAHPRQLVELTGKSFDSVAFSPDGHTLAAGDQFAQVQLWDITRPANPVPLGTLTGRKLGINGAPPVIFAPDGHTLVTGGNTDKTVVIWDITDRTHPMRRATLTGHDSTVLSAAMSPDGRMLATASRTDQTVILWDISDPDSPVRVGAVRRSALGPALALSPDGHTLATVVVAGAGVGDVTLWDFSALNALRTNAVHQACDITGRGLSRAEWTRYIPEIPYVRTCG